MRASAAQIFAQLGTIQSSFSTLSAIASCPAATAAGTSVPFLKISRSPNVSRTDAVGVLFTGGVHAREWTPPDALVSFAGNLLSSATAGTDVVYPVFSQPQPGGAAPVDFQAFTVPAELVQAILDQLDLYVAPLINPDGRDFSLIGPFAATNNKHWRTSTRPLGIPSCVVTPPGLDMSAGVDINRNCDIVWDFNALFDAATAATFSNATAPCTSSPAHPETFGGFAAGSEAETKNLNFLQTQVRHHIDVHMFGRNIEFPWGFADNQTTDATRNFLNATLNGTRDATYAEFIPQSLLTRLIDVGTFMHDAITRTATLDPRAASDARLQSEYLVSQSKPLGRIAGACDDFFFSQQFSAAPIPSMEVVASPDQRLVYTLECGHDTEHGFWASADEHGKIEREVHAALWAFLAQLTFPTRFAASNWPFV